jgi:hypothetical protein
LAYAPSMERLIGLTARMRPIYADAEHIVAEQEKKARRQKKKLDCIVQKAEAAQRFKKLGGWK